VAVQPKRAARLGLDTEAHRQRPLSGAAARSSKRRWPASDEERMRALQLTYEIGPTAAARQLGLPVSTVYGWLNKHRRDVRAAVAIAQANGWWDL
jgi:transposase-like protein